MKNTIKKLITLLLVSISITVWSKSNINDNVSHGTSATKHTYIVQLHDEPLTIYNGGIKGLNSTQLSQNNKSNVSSARLKINVNSKSNLAYKQYLNNKHQTSLDNISKSLSRTLKPKYQYHMVLNGFAISATASEASIIAMMPEIKSIQIAQKHRIQTDRGPLLIQAPSAWNGTATGISAKGEGILVGIIDTGIRHAHASFAEISPSDGYVHINPFGNGVFVGYCATTPSFCNNKLVGAYNYVSVASDPEDENEHGTHVASTAAGNTLSFDLGSGNSFNLTGVAPRANIIAYRIAGVSGTDDSGASVAAIDQAVIDGVDVINYSFGSEAFDPWVSAIARAFRNARAAGVIVVTSAANAGPNPGTIGSPADAPWITSVAASTHDRGEYPAKSMSGMTGGISTPPSTISGRSLTGEITTDIVYAGNFSNGDTNPEQCLNPFPAGTFTGQIVVCDRGDIARVQKAKNVAAGGAGGYVLANIPGGASFLADDIYVIPGIHIVANDGDSLKTWLSTGNDHTATINGTNGAIGINSASADIVAGFSSRGPNPSAGGVLKPSVSAPGVSILAAAIGEIDYTFKQGTSMSSPHVAGASVLIRQLKPSWTVGQVHSALVSTAITNLVKENGVTPADPFDIGGGRIDIDKALNAGLLVDETIANFTAANPSSGGDPKTLNLPSMANSRCSGSCSWSRIVTAAVTGSWTASYVTNSGLVLAVSPSNFSLTENQSQTLSITADVSGTDGQWLFGRLILTPDDSAISTSHFPVAVQVANSSLPSKISIETQRDSGQYLFSDVTSLATSSLEARAYLAEATPIQKSLEADSDNGSAFDDLTDGVSIELINVTAGSQLVFASTFNSSAEDLDLYVGFDTNDDGQVQESELLESSTSPNSDEQVLISQPRTGTYWVLVQNWSGASTGEDTYTSVAGVVGANVSSDISLNLPSFSNGSSAFDIAMNFDQISNQQYYGILTLGSGMTTDDLGVTAFVIDRVANDVSIAVSSTTIAAGSNITVTVAIEPLTNEQRNYTATIDVPNGLNVSSLTGGTTLSGSRIIWNTTVNGNLTNFTFNAQADSSLVGQTVNLSVEHSVDTPNAKLETSTVSFSVTNQSSGGGNSNGNSGGGSLFFMLLILFTSITAKRTK